MSVERDIGMCTNIVQLNDSESERPSPSRKLRVDLIYTIPFVSR